MKRTNARSFVDSNIFLYMLDSRDASKNQIATQTIGSLKKHACISVQVLQEVYVAAVRKLDVPPSDAKAFVEALARMPLTIANAAMVLKAIGTSEESKISFWDAMIVEAAVEAGCSRLLTEDFAHGQIIRGVRVENPFLISQ